MQKGFEINAELLDDWLERTENLPKIVADPLNPPFDWTCQLGKKSQSIKKIKENPLYDSSIAEEDECVESQPRERNNENAPDEEINLKNEQGIKN